MINIGIIGAGRIGKVHGESITYHIKGAQVKAMADPYWTPDSKKWAEQMGIPAYDDYHEILNDKSIDAVLICSSTQTHAPISIEAIRAGKHVFCEKPISRELSEIKAVMKELEHSKVKYQVGFNRRFDHNFLAVRNAVKNGQIGDPHIVKIASRDPDAPPIEYVKVSGGMFMDMTIHDFDMVRYLTGSDVTEVYVEAANLVDPKIGEAGDVDTAIISLKLANGALAVIDNSRKAVYGYDQRAEVFGSLGQVAITNDLPSQAILSTESGVTAEKPLHFFLERYMDSYISEVRDFLDAIQNDTEVPVSVNDGLQAVLIAMAANKSMKEHRPVLLSEIKF
jgi:myo-inositol 2-dehydrogenase / D-chiro-inositol 1-dehydrogenase